MRPKLKYSFNQLAGTNKHRLYINDDVTAVGNFNWETMDYNESETSAEYFRKKLDEIPDTDEIELHVNSNGGSVKEGVAIYNMLKRKPSKKTCYINGFAYSVASLICLACDEIIMGLGTSMMIHEMWTIAAGNADEFRKVADDLDVLMESNRKIYMERAKNLSEEELKKMMKEETILTPEQCLEYGFCDKISDKNANEQQMIQSEKNMLMQMRKDILSQQSLREEYSQFIQNANKQINKNNQEQQKEPKKEPKQKNLLGSFFNEIKNYK